MSKQKPPLFDGSLLLGRNARYWNIWTLPAVPLAIACACGVLVGTYLPLSMIAYLSAAVLCATVAILAKGATATAATYLLVVASMGAWQCTHLQPPSSDDIGQSAPADPTPIVLNATIQSPIEIRPDRSPLLGRPNSQPKVQSVLEIEANSVRDGSDWRGCSGRLRMFVADDVSELLIGDQVRIHGFIQRFSPPSNPGEPDFRKVFATRGIYARLTVDAASQIERVHPGRWGLRRCLAWIGRQGERTLQQYIGPPNSELTAAIVLGRRQAVSPDARDLLVETGTIHLLSVSGLHLAMVAALARVLAMLTNWSRATQVFMVLAACLFFALLTGAKPPVLRASILVASVLMASYAGKFSNTLNSLSVAAILLMILNPNNLLETGTQLSFVAVTTLVVTGRKLLEVARNDIALDRALQESRPVAMKHLHLAYQKIRQSLIVSFWVWVTSAPLVWNTYNILAPVSIISNLLVVPTLALALVFGMLTTSAGIILGPAAIPFGIICSASIDLILWMVTISAEIPFAYTWLPAPPGWLVTLFYAGLIAPVLATAAWPQIARNQQRIVLVWIAAWFVVAIPWALRLFERPPESAKVTFIDVGHGTSVLIQLPENQGTWLYDAGRLGDPTWSSAPIEAVLWSEGIYKIDGLIISHADSDHYNAVQEIVHRFWVKTLYFPPALLTDPQPGLDSVRAAVSKHHPPVQEIYDGSELRDRSGEVWATIIHPPEIRIEGTDNANSIVLLSKLNGYQIVLPGDLERPGTDLVLQADRPKPGGLLMAPHHGSTQQDPRTLLDWCRPSLVVVSGGKRAARREVLQAQSQTGALCYVTSKMGAIRVTISPESHSSIHHWLETNWQPLAD